MDALVSQQGRKAELAILQPDTDESDEDMEEYEEYEVDVDVDDDEDEDEAWPEYVEEEDPDPCLPGTSIPIIEKETALPLIPRIYEASRCPNNATCDHDSCAEFRSTFNHIAHCPDREYRDCSICGQWIAMMMYHSRECMDQDCKMPLCDEILLACESYDPDSYNIQAKNITLLTKRIIKTLQQYSEDNLRLQEDEVPPEPEQDAVQAAEEAVDGGDEMEEDGEDEDGDGEDGDEDEWMSHHFYSYQS